jgi:hypothetical protein
LAGTAQHDLLALEGVDEVVGIGRLRGDGRWAEIEGGGVTADAVLKGLELGAEAVVGGVDGTGFGHGF